MNFTPKTALMSGAILAALTMSPLAFAKDDAKKDQEKTVKSIIKDKAASEGFINLFQDEKTGSLMALIDENDLGKPFLHFTHTVNGAVDAGNFTGGYRLSDYIEFRKSFDKIEVIKRPGRFKFDPTNAISKSQHANQSIAILSSLKIEATDEKKKQYLVNLDSMLLSEALDKISPTVDPADKKASKRYKVGALSNDKTKYAKIKNYPDNTEIIVEYIFDNPAPTVRGGLEITDPRTVTIQIQHSFVKAPENNFKPRKDDSRVGYFHQQFDIMTSTEWANYGDVINRWNLVKKDPSAALSEPVKPITWWIENTTPVEWREDIKKATLAWNEAFESAGFKNAVEVKIQPDDATWDADDIRYNVLRWTASPRPPFGGYGPSFAVPDTGEIIAADIMLEFVFMKNRWFLESLMTQGGQNRTELMPVHDKLYCSAGHALQQSLSLGTTVAAAGDFPDMAKSELLRQGLYYLILHEVGHTLGLNHNMKATQLLSPQEAHDKDKTQGIVAGSVMDYPSLNLAPPGQKQGDYISYRPGPYDHWVIEYGYSTGLEDPAAEESRLQKILSRSTEKQLAFGNDAEDMRAPGRHIDPRVNIYDMSNDAIGFAQGQFELVKATLPKIKDKILKDGDTHHDLMMSVNSLLRSYRDQANVTSRYIGGIYVERALAGQKGATQPYTPTPEKTQKRAMDSLAKYVFAADILDEVNALMPFVQAERRGFNGFGKNEDPKTLDIILRIQKGVLDHILHPAVTKRLNDSSAYGNTYDLNTFMNSLTAAVFADDLRKVVNAKRQSLQVEYVNRLIKGLDSKAGYDHISKASIHNQLTSIAKMLKYTNTNGATKVHQKYLVAQIEKALN
jgi:hypothetical protein